MLEVNGGSYIMKLNEFLVKNPDANPEYNKCWNKVRRLVEKDGFELPWTTFIQLDLGSKSSPETATETPALLQEVEKPVMVSAVAKPAAEVPTGNPTTVGSEGQDPWI